MAEQCPICHRQTDRLFLLDLEGSSFLVCKDCLENPSVMKSLDILEEDSLDDSQYEDEEG